MDVKFNRVFIRYKDTHLTLISLVFYELLMSFWKLFQDICRGVTRREWNLSEHILLCTIVRHLYSSKQLTAVFSRLRHCENYVFGLELETALAKALDEVFISLSFLIITGEGNEVFILSGTIWTK